MRDMQDLMDQDLGLIFFAELIKLFGEDLDDIMGLLVKGHLHNSWKSVAPGDHPSAPGTFAPQTDQPGLIDMGHLQLSKNLFHPRINIVG